MGEARELSLPIGPKLRRHAPPHERPAHRRGLALKLTELGGIFGGERLGDGGEELRHFHDRALEAAKGRGKRGGIPLALRVEPEEPSCGDTGRHPADIGADPAIAERAGAESVLLLVGSAIVHGGSRQEGSPLI